MGSFVVAFAVSVEDAAAQAARQDADAEQIFADGVDWLVWELLNCLEPDTSRYTYCKFMLRTALGLEIPRKDTADQGAEKPDGLARKVVTMAGYTAHLADPPPGTDAVSQRASEAFDDHVTPPVRLLRLKPTEVGTYIGSALQFWVERGASVWTAQVLAWYRDELLDDLLDEGALLLVDSDAVAIFVVGASKEALPDEELTRRLATRLSKRFPSEATRLWPRLGPFITDALEAGVRPEAFLPSYSLETVLAADSLLGLWAPSAGVFKTNRVDKVASGLVSAADLHHQNRPAADGSMQRCRHVNGDAAHFASVPWLVPEGDLATPRIGLRGAAWTLASTTFRAHAILGLGAGMGATRLSPNKQFTVGLQTYGEPISSRLSSVRIDGDGVGKWFGSHPPARLPELSLEVALTTVDALTSAAKAVVVGLGIPPDGISELPLDLIYIGGDDVFVTVPTQLLQSFIDAFGSHPVPPGFSGWTAAVSELEPAGKTGDDWQLTKELHDVVELACGRLTRGGLRVAKTRRSQQPKHSDFTDVPCRVDFALVAGGRATLELGTCENLTCAEGSSVGGCRWQLTLSYHAPGEGEA